MGIFPVAIVYPETGKIHAFFLEIRMHRRQGNHKDTVLHSNTRHRFLFPETKLPLLSSGLSGYFSDPWTADGERKD
jgi:hypothetical protein